MAKPLGIHQPVGSERALPTPAEDHIECCQPDENGDENRNPMRRKNGFASLEYDDRNQRRRREKNDFQKPKELPRKFVRV
jgi:hypothetical protein